MNLTPAFCINDLRENKHLHDLLARIGNDLTTLLNEKLETNNIQIFYRNVPDYDPSSELYNPDGSIGRFQIVFHQ